MDRNERREANGILGFGLVWWLIAIIAVLAVSAAIWGISVATAPVKGRGDAFKQQQSAENWTAAQAEFEDNYALYEATLVKIEVAKARAEAAPQDSKLQTEYTGLVNFCTNVAADYNADTRKYLKKDFIAADLPTRLEPSSCAI